MMMELSIKNGARFQRLGSSDSGRRFCIKLRKILAVVSCHTASEFAPLTSVHDLSSSSEVFRIWAVFIFYSNWVHDGRELEHNSLNEETRT